MPKIVPSQKAWDIANQVVQLWKDDKLEWMSGEEIAVMVQAHLDGVTTPDTTQVESNKPK